MSTETELPVFIPASPTTGWARVLRNQEEQHLTFERTESARDAIALGLAQALARTSISWAGRELRFLRVYNTWAEPENLADFPALAVISLASGEYDSSVLTPQMEQISDGTGRYLKEASEIRQDFAVVIYTSNPVDRSGLTAALEDAFEPGEFMTGLRLCLPYYFSAHATYEKLGVHHDDDASNVQRRRWRSVFTVRGHMTQYVPVGAIAPLVAEACVVVTDPSDLPTSHNKENA